MKNLTSTQAAAPASFHGQLPHPSMRASICKQGGFGVGCFFLTVAFLVLIVMLGVKLVPTYVEDAAIGKALERVAETSGINAMPQRRIIREIEKELFTEDLAHIDFARALTTRSVNGRRELRINYEVAIPIYRNIALLLDFDHRALSN